MEKSDLRIVFMGTPEFAVASLRKLVDEKYNVVGVVTMPDKPAGRGHKIQFSDVKKYALENNLPLLQPEKLKSPEFLQQLAAWKADLQIVVAFRMLPEVVWNMPSKGTFNLHASLLPAYRGAAPINWAIINGEKKTGATTFFLTHEIDTGNVIFQEQIPILEEDTAGTLHDKLMTLGAELVIKTVDAILQSNVKPIPQENMLSEGKSLPAAPKLYKETCKIDWSKTCVEIYNFVRGLSPYPAAWTELKDMKGRELNIKIYAVEPEIYSHEFSPGILKTDEKTFVKIAVSDGFIKLKNIQLPSKKRMNTEELLRGYKITEDFKVKF
ncbi:MAG: methionyl-tRNA formyltransferase [Candidatus Azobacteroides sp.]|nr:methionyl-tRNA formyltransferase [Candidatus Azobacteroides sp.]